MYISKLQSKAAPCQSVDVVLKAFNVRKCGVEHFAFPPTTTPAPQNSGAEREDFMQQLLKTEPKGRQTKKRKATQMGPKGAKRKPKVQPKFYQKSICRKVGKRCPKDPQRSP